MVTVEGLSATTNVDGYAYILNVPASTSTLVTVRADTYEPYSGTYAINSWSCDLPVTLVPAVPPLPPLLSRAQILQIQTSFNSLTVQISSGSLPWFDAALVSLSPADRQLVYAAKHANGDTHAIVHYSDGRPLYPEPGQPYQNYNTVDYGSNPAAFVAMVSEVIAAGFTPMVFLQEDSEAATETRLQAAVAALQPQGLLPYVTFNPGFDGTFYGWSPAQVQQFGHLFRQLNPNGYLTVEFNTGHIPVGNGPADYAPGGMMTDYDGVLAEFDLWPMTGPAEWQILGRLLGPAFHRAPNQGSDDPHPPYYLVQPSPRGPYAVVCFEYGTYNLVRTRYTQADLNAAIAYYLGLGCSWAK